MPAVVRAAFVVVAAAVVPVLAVFVAVVPDSFVARQLQRPTFWLVIITVWKIGVEWYNADRLCCLCGIPQR